MGETRIKRAWNVQRHKKYRKIRMEGLKLIDISAVIYLAITSLFESSIFFKFLNKSFPIMQ